MTPDREGFKHLASAMKKVLPPPLLAEVIAHLDPLTPFVEFLSQPPEERRHEAKEQAIRALLERLPHWESYAAGTPERRGWHNACCTIAAALEPLLAALLREAEADQKVLRELLIEQTKDEAGPEVEYCWYCQNDINGKSTGEKRPHADDCWLMRVRSTLAGLRAPAPTED